MRNAKRNANAMIPLVNVPRPEYSTRALYWQRY